MAVTGTVNFNQNTIRSWAGDALEGFMCHNRTSLESNTFLVDGGVDAMLNQSTTPFHTSCGNPQVHTHFFTVVRRNYCTNELAFHVYKIP